MPKRKIVSLGNVSAFFKILSYSRKTLVGGISIELKDFTLLNNGETSKLPLLPSLPVIIQTFLFYHIFFHNKNPYILFGLFTKAE